MSSSHGRLAAAFLSLFLASCASAPPATLPICRLHPDLATAIQREIEAARFGARAGIWLARPGSEPLYALGVAKMEAGDVEEGRLHLRRFLSMWDQTDWDLEIVDDARARLPS